MFVSLTQLLLPAYKLRKHLGEQVEFRIFEKSQELGGTWFENRYPGQYALIFR